MAVAAVGVLGSAVLLQAEDRQVVRQRMEQRLGAIDALKAKGLVGENNRGYLESRGAMAASDGQVMAAENADRSTVYAAIATQQGTTSDQVGRARAKQLAERSTSGVWVQRETGEWYRK